MVAVLLSRILIVVCGILYPAYSSFKAVKSKSHREYTKWMMYWIVFALFQATETLTDTFISWLPLYYELKILIVLWLVLPITQGSKQLYRLIIHPFLVRHEEKIDQYLVQAGKQGLQAMRRLSRAGINKAASTVVTSAIRGQAVITETLLRAQEDQNQTDSSDGPQVYARTHRASSSTSTDMDLEPFEIIEEEIESCDTGQDDLEVQPDATENGTESRHDHMAPKAATESIYYHADDSEGLYRRTYDS